MIPSSQICYQLWKKYQLPEKKRIHSQIIADTASLIGSKLIEKGIVVNLDLLNASCLLHDIDKAVEKLPSERHPESAVRILKEENLSEVAAVIATHSLHCILNNKIAPRTWEQKLLYLSDKMVKQELVGVDERFALWWTEDLPDSAVRELDQSYPLVKKLEKEIFAAAGIIDTAHLAKRVR